MKSRRLSIPNSRSTVCDILRYDRYVPTYAHDRVCDVAELKTARDSAASRISWPAIFLKAYAITAEQFPRLRQTWMNWPWPYLYEHGEHVGTLVVHREFEDDDWLFWAQLRQLDSTPLPEIQRQIDRFQQGTVKDVYRRQLWLARKPVILRRLFWWMTFQLSGQKKCKRLGTFFLSTISGGGAEIQNPPSMLTSGFTYGPINSSGKSRVTITYDHRLLDGHHIAAVLCQLEENLHSQLLPELKHLARSVAA